MVKSGIEPSTRIQNIHVAKINLDEIVRFIRVAWEIFI
jgi:hypothetical protein